MAGRGGKKGGKDGAATSGFDWGKVTTIALAVTAVSGAVVAVSGGIPKLISAFTGGEVASKALHPGPRPQIRRPGDRKSRSRSVQRDRAS